MRAAILTLLRGFALSSAPLGVMGGTFAATVNAETVASQDQAPIPRDLDVDIDIGQEGGAWYASPLWIGIGVVVLVVVVALIAMASRGGGTTVIKD